MALLLLLLQAGAQNSFYPQNLFPFKGNNEKYGFTDQDGKILVLPKYDEATAPADGMSLVKLNGKYGYIDETGKEVIPAQYDHAYSFSEERAAVKKGDKWGFINKAGKVMTDFAYGFVYSFSEGLAAVQGKSGYGYIDINGKKVIPFEFDEAYSFSGGLAKVLKGKTIYDKQGFIDKKGKLVVPYQYDHDFYTYSAWEGARNFDNGLCYVSKNFSKGYINTSGQEVIPCRYSRLTPFHRGFAAYCQASDNKWGIIDKNGKELTPAIFDKIDLGFVDIGYQLIITAKEDKSAKNYSGYKFGLFSTLSNNNITLPYYDAVGKISGGMISIQLNKKYGFIDSTGRLVIAPKYDYTGDFENGTAVVNLGKTYGIINKAGKEIVPVKYDDLENLSEGMAVVMVDGKAGYADGYGREVITPQYANAGSFTEGIAIVKNTKFGFIDKTGKAITEMKYDDVTPFLNGLALVIVNKKFGVVNKTGKEIVPPIYTEISSNGAYLYFEKDGKWGVMNNSGSIIIPAQFEGFIQAFVNDTAVAVKNGRAVYIDKTGQINGEPYQ